jgi:hypothetical protein
VSLVVGLALSCCWLLVHTAPRSAVWLRS